ncbi:hypothetical protein EVAR_42050_1 [Eumeta japonica]|uniref:Uncharacterized protein n=1 Tax=Eumeta variegata TaxID=151549 RepID=A0A4C1XTD2_EUMVA|nr:hypothetical protein EVAR_42050_1 [Eumeta japonica]
MYGTDIKEEPNWKHPKPMSLHAYSSAARRGVRGAAGGARPPDTALFTLPRDVITPMRIYKDLQSGRTPPPSVHYPPPVAKSHGGPV